MTPACGVVEGTGIGLRLRPLRDSGGDDDLAESPFLLDVYPLAFDEF